MANETTQTPSGLPMSGKPQQGGAVDPRAAERLKRRMRIQENMGRIKHKFIVASGKGGVGKSTVATNLAVALADAGNKVGILDMDLTGPNVPRMLGVNDAKLVEGGEGLTPVQVSENLSVISMQFLLPDPDAAVIWRGPIKMQIIGQFLGDVQWGDLDYLVVDLPPGTSDEPLSVAQNIPDADGVILVSTPQEVATADVRKSSQFVQRLELPVLGVVENMSGLRIKGTTTPGAEVSLDGAGSVTADDDGRFEVDLDVFKRGGGEAMAEALDTTFLGAIPLDLAITRCGDAGTPFVAAHTDSAAAAAFRSIVDTLVKEHSEEA